LCTKSRVNMQWRKKMKMKDRKQKKKKKTNERLMKKSKKMKSETNGTWKRIGPDMRLRQIRSFCQDWIHGDAWNIQCPCEYIKSNWNSTFISSPSDRTKTWESGIAPESNPDLVEKHEPRWARNDYKTHLHTVFRGNRSQLVAKFIDKLHWTFTVGRGNKWSTTLTRSPEPSHSLS
jgi:hypothetical protein